MAAVTVLACHSCLSLVPSTTTAGKKAPGPAARVYLRRTATTTGASARAALPVTGEPDAGASTTSPAYPSSVVIPLLPADPLSLWDSTHPATTTPPPTERPEEAAGAAEGQVEEAVPTPVMPSGPMMTQFLLHFHSMLQHMPMAGEDAAATGEGILERVHVGMEGLEHHPCHGAAPSAASRAKWHALLVALESCLGELHRDMAMLQRYHQRQPPSLALHLVEAHCNDTARLLCRL